MFNKQEVKKYGIYGVVIIGINRQIEILNIIKKYVDENKIAPTVREICNLSGLKSTSTVYGYLTRLEEEGYIKKKDNSPRSIVLYETDGE